jgi:hypothetical protein
MKRDRSATWVEFRSYVAIVMWHRGDGGYGEQLINVGGDATATPWSNDGVGDEPSTNDEPWRQELKELSWQKLAIELCRTT